MRVSKLHTIPHLWIWWRNGTLLYLPPPLPINEIGLGVFLARHDFFPGSIPRPKSASPRGSHTASSSPNPRPPRSPFAGFSLLKCGVILEAAELRTIFGVCFRRKKTMSKLAQKTAACKTSIAAAGENRKKEGNWFRPNFRPVNFLPKSQN